MSSFINIIFRKRFRIPKTDTFESLLKRSPLTVKVAFGLAALVMASSAVFLLAKVNTAFSVEIPKQGGTLTEGLVGLPRFINPILDISDTDHDLTSLVYSGLMKATPEGILVPDLAQSYTISPDGLTYTFTLKPNLTFQDDTALTADDVIFTIAKAQDPLLNSPKRVSWDGVQVEKVDERTVRFTLKQTYAPFLENMIIGILPAHIWKDLGAEAFPFSQSNINPIGSGPYKIKDIKRDSSGLPTVYELIAFNDYASGAPYIKNIVFRFYTDNSAALKALNQKEIDAVSGLSPSALSEITRTDTQTFFAPLPRIFAVFFNQNQNPIFTNREVRRALDLAVDKNQIVNEVLQGRGSVIDGPIPPGSKALLGLPTRVATTTATENFATAQKILEDNGWVKNPNTGIYYNKDKKQELKFSLSTSDALDLKQTAGILQAGWQKLGAAVDIKIFGPGDLNQNVIRPRQYESLLFGEVVGRDIDLYPFWHSSQRNDPGLNIAMYTNITADKVLEDERTTLDPSQRQKDFAILENKIKDDSPAIFLFSPDFIYVAPKAINNITLNHIINSSERFLDVNNWYIETDNVWKIFLKQ